MIGSVADFFNNAGVIITVFLGLAAIAVPIWVYLKQRSRKDFSKEVQVTQLVNIHSEAKDRITIHYEGEQIKQVHLVEIDLENSGNVPIRAEDFERPLTIELGLGIPITVDVTSTTPNELEPRLEVTPRGVELQPLLLNAGDSLKLKILVRDFVGEVAFDYRIVGISKLIDARAQTQRSWHRLFAAQDSFGWATAAVVTGLGVAVLGSSIGYLFGDDPDRSVGPSYDYPESTVTFRNGKVICAEFTGYREGYIAIAKSPDGRAFQVIPKARIKSIRPGC